MTKRILFSLLAVVFLISVIGCASIVSGRMQQLPVFSYPSEAIATVGNSRQKTPATFNLDRRMGAYQVKVEKEGYEPVTVKLKKTINGWVFGNIIFGGIIGLVIDIGNGSASAFTPSEVDVNLIKEKMGGLPNDKDVLIVKLKKK